ncbi:MAG: endolytic transglycosylase MltG [bacterium]
MNDIKSTLLKNLGNRRSVFIGILLLVIITVILFLHPFGTRVNVNVVVSPGMGAKQIASDLKERGLIQSETLFLILVRLRGAQNSLQAGEYVFKAKTGTFSILSKIIKGEVRAIKFTVPEGYTAMQIARLVEEKKFGSAKVFLEKVRERKLEGYLFPETYMLHRGMDEDDIIRIMRAQFDKVFTQELKKRSLEIGMSEKEVVTLASIIEKEAKQEEERTLISSVFHNRLKKGWLLESCATVQYALGEHKKKLSYDDLRVVSDYNTYLHVGLPPAPICNPGEASLRAALYPAQSDDLFFVSGEDGTHRFSRYYKQHLRNKKL